MSNMRDVAQRAGVSVSTVAAVINENKYVSEQLRIRIEDAIRQTGYRKRCPEESDQILAVILPGIYSSFFPPLLNGVSDVVSENNLSLLLLDSKRSFQLEIKLLQKCIRQGVTNIILDSVCDIKHEEEYFAELRRQFIECKGVNIAVVERKLADEAFFSVYVDNYNASAEAMKHLIGCGCRRIAHIGGANEFPHTRIRENAYRAALEENGMTFDPRLLLQGDFTPISGSSTVRNLLSKGIPIDGVFAANDQMAIGAIKALHSCGYRIPEDCKVVGFDDLPASSLITPSLTTIHFPIYQLGYQAAQLIAQKLHRQNPISHVKLECRLIERESTVAGKFNDWDLSGW